MAPENGVISGKRAGIRSIAGGAALAALLSISAAFGTAADAATLGKFTVLSALGQPFHGEIDVAASNRQELDTLGVRLASEESYRQAGVQYSPALQALKFTLARRRGGPSVIKVTSAEALDEPIVDLLVELAWRKGRSAYGYTALIDPPGQSAARSFLVRVLAAGVPPTKAAHAKSATRMQSRARLRSARPADAESELEKQVRMKEEEAVAQKHKLAAAHERIVELTQTVKEQQQLLAVAATAGMEVEPLEAAVEMRAAPEAAAVMRASHEAGAQQSATGSSKPGPRVEAPRAAVASPAEPGLVDMISDEPLYAAGGATLVLLVAMMSMRAMRRRRYEADDDLEGLAPTLQPAT